MANNVILYTRGPDGIIRAVEGTGATDQENRLPVDVGQTGFFEGREFRTFRRLSIPTESEILIRATVPLNIILYRLQVELIQGQIELISEVGGTPSGTWTSGPTVFPRNTMTEVPDPVPTAQVVLEEGGTVSGTTELDVVMAKTSDNSNFAGSVGGSIGDERGISPDTYYIRIVNTDSVDAIGVLHAYWAERP